MSNKDNLRKLYEEGLNSRNFAVIGEVISDDYEGVRGGKGPVGFEQVIRPLIQAFPDITWTIEDMIAEDDRVVLRWTWRGTHEGPLGSIEPTRKQISDAGIAIYQFQDGKAVKAWLQTDRLGLLQQLGVLPVDIGMGKPAK